MEFEEFVKNLELLEKTGSRLEKINIIAKLIKEADEADIQPAILLLQGRVFPVWSKKQLGIAEKVIQKAIHTTFGESQEKIQSLFQEQGDLGLVAQICCEKKTQSTLAAFGNIKEKLSVVLVFQTIKKLAEIQGSKAVDMKTGIISSILHLATPTEAKYIVRILLEELRIGIAEGTIREGIIQAIFPKILGLSDKEELKKTYDSNTLIIDSIELAKEKSLLGYRQILCNSYEDARGLQNALSAAFQAGYDALNEFHKVTHIAKTKGYKGLLEITLEIGTPFRVMLMQKVNSIDEATKKINLPLQLEYKYDGFRCQAHKIGNTIELFTRNLENVTEQFPDIVSEIQKNVTADEAILDGEILGIDPETKKYIPFQNISQRIKRKFNILELSKKLPVRYAVWDILYKNKTTLLKEPLTKRREILLQTIKEGEIHCSKAILVKTIEEGEEFYKKSLEEGNEGVVVKDLLATYQPGNRVGCWLKIKPIMDPLDLVIVGAEWGEGKRKSWLTSFNLACKNGDEYLTIGKVGSGLKEKESEGTTYEELTKDLVPLIVESNTMPKKVTIKPKIVVQVAYEQIQKSPTYKSGFALRFPRIISIRSDLDVHEADDLEKVSNYYKEQSF